LLSELERATLNLAFICNGLPLILIDMLLHNQCFWNFSSSLKWLCLASDYFCIIN